jgi:hypothetical protein
MIFLVDIGVMVFTGFCAGIVSILILDVCLPGLATAPTVKVAQNTSSHQPHIISDSPMTADVWVAIEVSLSDVNANGGTKWLVANHSKITRPTLGEMSMYQSASPE